MAAEVLQMELAQEGAAREATAVTESIQVGLF